VTRNLPDPGLFCQATYCPEHRLCAQVPGAVAWEEPHLAGPQHSITTKPKQRACGGLSIDHILCELLAYVVEDVLLRLALDGRLLHRQKKMAPSLETDQLCTRNGGRSELCIVVELQCVICGMEY
jgi:hypothetical protein